MKRALLSGVAAVAILAGISTAHAADIGQRYVTKGPVTAPMPYYNWSGVYIGISGGYGWGDSNQVAAIPGFALATGDFDTSGGLIGATLGVNYQVGPWVWGLEGDISWTNIDASTTTFGIVPAGAVTGTFNTELNWLATVRGRIGYAFDRVMPYVTAGVAFGDVDASFAVVAPGPLAFAATGSETNVGWTVGAGVEFAVMPNLSLKGEYLYVDLGDVSPAPGFNAEFNTHIVRAGLNWKF
jgi:outer membrane immunogenic protein